MRNFKKKILIQSIVLACMVIVFAAFFVLFKKNIEHQLTIVNTLRGKKNLFSQSASGIVALKGEWETARQYYDDLENYAPSKDDLVLIPEQFKNLAKVHGVTVTFTYGQESSGQQAASLQTVPFGATIEGPLVRIQSFFSAFDEEFHTVQVDTLDVLSQSGGDLRVSLSGKVQYY